MKTSLKIVMNKKFFLFFFEFIFVFSNAFSSSQNDEKIIIETKNLSVLTRLSSYESSFKEYSKIVEENYKNLNSGREPNYQFFYYKNTENFSLQGLASRCNIPYETIATLNQIESSSDKITNKDLILPTVPGLFIPLEKGKTSVEVLLQENYATKQDSLKGTKWKINGRDFVFLKNKRFSPTERAFFLDSSMQLPLSNASFWISSEFGKRKNPFSGELKNHNGIDMAAAEGTPVYAVKDGAVAVAIENDSVFGNYIILSHDLGKTTSVYAHLKSIEVEQYQSVKKGDLIGYVGQTGEATGPHLHFEIRQSGKAQNPRDKLNFN